MLTISRVVNILGTMRTSIKNTMSYIHRNMLSDLSLESLIGSFCIVSFTVIFEFVNNRTALALEQTIFDVRGKTRFRSEDNT